MEKNGLTGGDVGSVQGMEVVIVVVVGFWISYPLLVDDVYISGDGVWVG